MDEQGPPGIPVPDQPATPQPAPVVETPQAQSGQPAPQAQPSEEPWLLHYAGTEPLEKAGYTWQPDQVVAVPESTARTLFGADNLRVVRDLELFNAMRERANP